MTSFFAPVQAWAHATFSQSCLPDKRLLARLITYASRQASRPTASTSRACEANIAEREGAYRLLENDRISSQGILEGPFQATQRRCDEVKRVLAIQDSTSIGVLHKDLYEEVKGGGGANGFIVHSTLAVDGTSGEVLGLADQFCWLRSQNRPGHATRNQRAHGEKESYKWTHAVKRLQKRGNSEVITIADREADVFEFLTHLCAEGLKFVVRCCANRRIGKDSKHLHHAAQNAPTLGYRKVVVEQRGGQPAGNNQVKRLSRQRETITTRLQATQEMLLPPRIRRIEGAKPLKVNIVRVSSVSGDKNKASETAREWILLTSEPVATLEEVERVVEDYEYRWLVEEFHKSWKTGCRIETRPLQKFSSVKRMMAITAAIAVRLLQLRDIAHNRCPDGACADFLTQPQWECLWLSTEKRKIPKVAPPASWAALALAKLGGWYDTKRTGRIGWTTIWEGYTRLETLANGYTLAKAAPSSHMKM